VSVSAIIDPELDKILDQIFAEEDIDLVYPQKEIEDDDTQKIILTDDNEEQQKMSKICPECKGTGIYVGLGMFPAEKCKTCGGKGKVCCGSCHKDDDDEKECSGSCQKEEQEEKELFADVWNPWAT